MFYVSLISSRYECSVFAYRRDVIYQAFLLIFLTFEELFSVLMTLTFKFPHVLG